MNALRRLGIKPFYSPRRDMPERVRMAFQCGADTDMIATIFGYPESSIERWLHQTANQFEETQGEKMKAGEIIVVDDPGDGICGAARARDMGRLPPARCPFSVEWR